jgi:hypothetical protein
MDHTEKEAVLQIGKDLLEEVCQDDNEVHDINAIDSDEETEERQKIDPKTVENDVDSYLMNIGNNENQNLLEGLRNDGQIKV